MGGYSFGDWRIGLSLGPTWEQRTVGDYSSGGTEGSDRLWWSLGAQASYMLGERWSFTASYSDQTILGPTYNAVLNRSAGLAAIHRFE
jgi:hypothetical protein